VQSCQIVEAKEDGASIAPNTPCAARAVTSIANDWAAPPIAEAIGNPSAPPMNVHLRAQIAGWMASSSH
jgi:hypothetical protein